MRNKLLDLNNHLFEELERLNDDELTKDNLDFELQRSKAMTTVARSIIENANVMLAAKKHFDENGKDCQLPEILQFQENPQKKILGLNDGK